METVHRTLVTGARAKTGAPLVERLALRDGLEVRAGSSAPDRLSLPQNAPPTVTAVRFSWDDAGSWPAAVDDLDSLFIVRPDREDAPQLIADLLAVTPEHTHVVLLSEIDLGYFDQDAWAKRVEQAVASSDRTWTVLRPSWFMQVLTDPRFFLDDVARHGRLPFVSEGQPVAWIDARDIAAVAEEVLLETSHHERTYEITGPQALTLAQTARLLQDAVSRPVQHLEITMDEALGTSDGFARENDYGAFDRVRRGITATTTDTVEKVTGTPPRSLREFADDHSTLFHDTRRDVAVSKQDPLVDS